MEGRPPTDLEQQNQQDEEEVPNKQTNRQTKQKQFDGLPMSELVYMVDMTRGPFLWRPLNVSGP